MNKQIDLNSYQNFVEVVTSDASNNLDAMSQRMNELNETVNISLLMTGAVGLSAEGGELMEIVKKCVFQGKPMDEDTVFHMKRELGDIMWYMAQACIALNVTFEELVEMNVAKLEARYPGGSFNVHSSEVRVEGDI